MNRPARNAPSRRLPPPERSRQFGLWLLVITGLLLGAPVPPATGQTIGDAITMEDLGLTMRLSPASRPAGMAGTYTSIGSDVHSLIYNPAGLTGVFRPEFTLGFQHQRRKLELSYYGTPAAVDFSNSTLDHLSVAFPIPTYRGSLVIAAGVYRLYSNELDLLYRGYNTTTRTQDHYRLQQSGSLYSYTLGAATDLSPWVSLGGSMYLLNGSVSALTQYSFDFDDPIPPGTPESVALVDDVTLDVTGVGASVGFQIHLHPIVRIGLSVTTATRLFIDGRGDQEIAAYYQPSLDTFLVDSGDIAVDYTLPFRFNGGIALFLPNVMLTGEVGYSDWAEARVDGKSIKDENLKAYFTDVLSWSFATEVTLPRIPVRLRAGYQYLPYALEYLNADRMAPLKRRYVIGLDPDDAFQQAEVTQQRQVIAGGIGVLIGTSFTFDLSLEQSRGERRVPTMTDRRTSRRAILTAAYRF